MSDHTSTRLSGPSLDAVHRRIVSADDRVREAAEEMTGRLFRLVDRVSGPVCPTDCPEPDLPAVPPVPAAVRAVYDSSCIHGGSVLGNETEQKDPRFRDSIFRGGSGDRPKPSATPEQLVAAIHAADEYAELFERAAREYREATAEAIAQHVADQRDSVAELAGLVAQVSSDD